MKTAFIVLLSICALYTYGQNFPEVIRRDSIYIPATYEMLDSISGDLNRDSYKDLLIIFKNADEEDLSETSDEPIDRPLLIYLRDSLNNYHLITQNNKVVLCYSCGGVFGDPYNGMAVKNGYFTIEHYGGSAWRWTRYITFKYSESDSTWYLHKDGGESFHASDPDNTEINIKTVKDFGIVKFEDFEY